MEGELGRIPPVVILPPRLWRALWRDIGRETGRGVERAPVEVLSGVKLVLAREIVGLGTAKGLEL